MPPDATARYGSTYRVHLRTETALNHGNVSPRCSLECCRSVCSLHCGYRWDQQLLAHQRPPIHPSIQLDYAYSSFVFNTRVRFQFKFLGKRKSMTARSESRGSPSACSFQNLCDVVTRTDWDLCILEAQSRSLASALNPSGFIQSQ